MPDLTAGPHVMLMLSAACPAQCSYCFGPRHGGVMSGAVLAAALDWIASLVADAPMRRSELTFHGGEPLAAGYGLWVQALKGLDQRCPPGRLALAVQSNLWLLDERWCELLAGYGVDVGTSLDGPPAITDRQRGAGYYERTRRGLDLAREHGLSPGCIATLTSWSAARWRDVLEFFRREALAVALHPAAPLVGGPRTDWTVSTEQYATALQGIVAWYPPHVREFSVSTIDRAARAVATGRPQSCHQGHCAGRHLAIAPDGGIYPCSRFCGQPAFQMGTVMTRPTLTELDRSAPLRLLRHRELAVEQLCRGCRHLGYCHGGCPYHALASRPDPARDPYCVAYQALYDAVGQRLAAESATPANLAAIANRAPAGQQHPLLRAGALTSVTRPDRHPSLGRRLARHVRTTAGLAQQAPAGDDWLHRRIGRQLRCAWLAPAAILLQAMRPRCLATEVLEAVLASPLISQVELVLCGSVAAHPNLGSLLERLARPRPARRVVLRLAGRDVGRLAGLAGQVAQAADCVEVYVDGPHDGLAAVDRLRRAIDSDHHRRTVALVWPWHTTPARAELRAMARAAASLQLPWQGVLTSPHVALIEAIDYPDCSAARRLRRWRDLLREGAPLRRHCGLGQTLSVTASGDCYPCPRLHHDQWWLGRYPGPGPDQEQARAVWDELATWTVDTRRPCSGCGHRYLCGGTCSAPYLAEAVALPEPAEAACPDAQRAAWRALEARATAQLATEAVAHEPMEGR